MRSLYQLIITQVLIFFKTNPLNKRNITAAFEKFLNRKPENDFVINDIIKSKDSLVDLCFNIATSEEFISKQNIKSRRLIYDNLLNSVTDKKIQALLTNGMNLNEPFETLLSKLLLYKCSNESKSSNSNKNPQKIKKINSQSNFIKYYKNYYYPKLGSRKDDFLILFNLAVQYKVKNIVETGCIRKADNFEGDGQSTLLFYKYISMLPVRGHLTSIDTDPSCKFLLDEMQIDTNFINQDSVKALALYNQPIDLLYLDSFDYEKGQEHQSSLHHLNELLAASNKLHSKSIIAIDDNMDGNGKGQYIKKYFDHIGLKPILDSYLLIYLLP